MRIGVVKRFTSYCIGNDNGQIIVAEVNTDGNLSLFNHKEQKEFVFKDSEPEMVETIAKLMLKAVELAKKEK